MQYLCSSARAQLLLDRDFARLTNRSLEEHETDFRIVEVM